MEMRPHAMSLVTVILMVACLPLIADERLLTIIYAVGGAFTMYYRPSANDWVAFTTGLVVTCGFEWLLVSIGTVTFAQKGLLGVMPLWLPLLWACICVALNKSIKITYNYV